MIPVYGTRAADGLHVAIDFEAPIAADQRRGDDPGRRRQPRRPRPRPPGQYYWLHRRWVKRF